MISRRALLVGLGAVAVAGCASDPRFLRYDGPEVTRIQVFKGKRQLQLHPRHARSVFDRNGLDVGLYCCDQRRDRRDLRDGERGHHHQHLSLKSAACDGFAERADVGQCDRVVRLWCASDGQRPP